MKNTFGMMVYSKGYIFSVLLFLGKNLWNNFIADIHHILRDTPHFLCPEVLLLVGIVLSYVIVLYQDVQCSMLREHQQMIFENECMFS
jgi:hypothetical protein